MTPAATAAQLAHALLGDQQASLEWAAVAEDVAGDGPSHSSNQAFMAFAAARVALHEGRVGDARTALAARARIDDNAWGHACLLRAEARLAGDATTLQAAIDAFDAIDARFEWAITALLAEAPLATRARAVLDDLGATPPTPLATDLPRP